MSSIRTDLFRALRALGTFTVLTGVLYPALVTGAAKLLFPAQAAGSLVSVGGQIRGSALIGQGFASDRYFHGRPSAIDYNAAASGGSNLGPLAPALDSAVRTRRHALGNANDIPVDLLTRSASGLDPDISPAAARFQIGRVARARGLDSAAVARLVEDRITQRSFGVLGEPRVNLLRLNLSLDSVTR